MSHPHPRRRIDVHCATTPPRRSGPLACGLPAAALAALWLAALPAAACDLKAEFIAPAGGTANGAQPVQWELRFDNVAASGDCPANEVRLVRQAMPGSSPALGGAGPVPLRSLAPGKSVTLRIVENAPPKSGTHVYRLSYANKFLDANERNHQPSKSVTFHLAYTLGG